jgi:hypothetical protein
MSKSKGINPDLVTFAVQAGSTLIQSIIASFSGDKVEWKKIVDILPEEFASKARILEERERARDEMEAIRDSSD